MLRNADAMVVPNPLRVDTDASSSGTRTLELPLYEYFICKWAIEYQDLILFSHTVEFNGKNIIFPLVSLFARVGLLLILMGFNGLR